MPFPPNFDHAWDLTQPPDTQLANLLGQDIRNLKDDIMQKMSLLSGTLANRPAPETVNATWGGVNFGLLYFSTDTSQIFQWNGAAWTDITASILGTTAKYKFEGSNIVPVTVANSNALSPLQGIVIPANDIGAGQTFFCDCAGVLGIAGGGGQSLTVYTYLDNVEIDGGTPLNLFPAAANNQMWGLRFFFAGLTTGAAGTIQRPNMLWMSSPSGGGTTNNGSALGVGVTVDTTIQHTLQLKVLWNNALAANTITQQTMNCFRTG